MLQFDESYFEPSIVDDFYVKPMVKRAWASQLEVLSVIDQICKRHNIQYFAEYGTLLGAIRHKGFIPWDDDLDIGMMREDYEKFHKFARQELPEGMELLSVRDYEDFDQLLARVVNSRTVNMNPEFLEKYHGCPYCCGVDIFITDRLPRNPEQNEIMYQLMYASGGLARYWKESDEVTADMWESLTAVEKGTGRTIDRTKNIPNQLYNLCEAICMMFQDEDADEVAMAVNLTQNREAYTIPSEYYKSYIEVPFETITIPVPIGYQEILVKRYGPNYMTPIKRWGTHDYPFYKSQEKDLVDYHKVRGMEIPAKYDVMPNPVPNPFWGVTHHRSLAKEQEAASNCGLYELRMEDLADYQEKGLPWRPQGIIVKADLLLQVGVKMIMDSALALGAKYFVIETLNFQNVEELDKELFDAIEELRWTDLNCYIENGFDIDELGNIRRNPYSDTKAISETIGAFNMYCGRDCFKMCLNIGYANVLHQNIRAMIDSIKDGLGLIHMNDNNGVENLKQMPYTFGTGRGAQTTDYTGILQALIRNEFYGGIVMDVDGLWENLPESLQGSYLNLLNSIGRDWTVRIVNERKE